MKLLFLRTILLSCLLSILLQCSSDRTPRPVPQISAKMLAEDASFIKLVGVYNKFETVVYNSLRDDHSQRVRDLHLRRVSSLLSYQDNRDSVALAIQKMGFTNLRQFKLDILRVDSAKRQLQQNGIQFNELPPKLLAEAYKQASDALGYKYPTIISASSVRRTHRGVTTLGEGSFCTSCHFNNCDECGDVGQDNEESTDDDTQYGAGGNACRARAESDRSNSRALAFTTVSGLLMGCGWSAGEVAAWATGISIETGPLAPVIGGGAGGIYVTVCAGSAIISLMATLNLIESNYQMALAECRK